MGQSLFLAFLVTTMLATSPTAAPWTPQPAPTKARLRGLSVVNAQVAWTSGTGGTVVRTTDGGKTWALRPLPGGDDLDVRDVEAFTASAAYALTIGEGEKSRIYKTTDGGETWALLFTNRDPKGFLDAIAFWDESHGLALGDPVEGRFSILATDDGGQTWSKIPAEGMPPALPKEGAFAASGTCLVTRGERDAWFATGGGAKARVFHSRDRGRTWTVHEAPIRAGSSASGIFSLAFRDERHGVVVGGTYDQPEKAGELAAWTEDGGATWTLAEGAGPRGYRSAVSFTGDGARCVAVGPSGSEVSTDGGQTWKVLGDDGFHAVRFAGPEAGWAVGEGGKIGRFAP